MTQQQAEIQEQVGPLFQQALKLHQTNQLAPAEQGYLRVLKLQPDHPYALHLLGAIATEKREFTRGEELILQALEIKPDIPEAMYNLGLVYQRQGKWEQAQTTYKKLLEKYPNNFEGLQNLGIVNEHLQELEKAVECYDRALEIKKDHIPIMLNKASVLNRLKRTDEALDLYNRILTLDASSAQAFHDQAVVFLQREDDKKAENLLRKALEINAEYAEAHNHLGVVLMQQGRFQEAKTHLEKAISLKPDYIKAYYHLSSQTKTLGEDVLDQLNGFRRQKMNQSEKTYLYFALAKIYENHEDWDHAFYFYRLGNESRKKEIDAFDKDQHIRQTRVLIASYTKQTMTEFHNSGLQTRKPIFIVGMPRSGTTLTEQILASHPLVYGAGELKHMGTILQQYVHAFDQKPLPEILKETTQHQWALLAEKYLEHIDRLAPDAEYVTDKMPFNYRHLGFISHLFPNATIIHCRRHPVDTCLSCYFQNFSEGNEFSFDLSHLAVTYRCYERLMTHWHEVLPIQIFDMDYEKTVSEPESQIKELLAFCGLPWDDQCLNFYKSKRSVRTASLGQVRQKIYTTSTKKWQRFSSYISPLQQALGDVQVLETGRHWQEMGQLEAAANCFERVCNANPENAQAWHLIGVARFQQGSYPAAAECINHAIGLKPEDASFHANLGLAVKAMGQLDTAEECQKEAVRLAPDSFINQRQLGNVYKLRGKLDEAIEQADKAIQINDMDVPAHLLKFQCLQQKKDQVGALTTIRRAAKKFPQSAPVHSSLGQVLLAAGQAEQARQYMDHVLEKNPNNAAYYLLRGKCSKALGDYPSADKDYRQCLALNPLMGAAYYELSCIGNCQQQDIRKMEEMTRKQNLPIHQKIPMLYGLGIAKDGIKDYSHAFACWQEANALFRQSFEYNIQRDAARWQHVRQHVFEKTVETWPALSDKVRTVFVVGMPCAGRNLVSRLLSGGYGVAGINESFILPDIVRTAPDQLGFDRGYPSMVEMLSDVQAEQLGQNYIHQAHEIIDDRQKTVSVDTQMNNGYFLGLIRRILPESRVIFCHRDLLDVCLAAYGTYFPNSMPFAKDLEELARICVLYQQTMQHWQQLFPGWIVEVAYPDLIGSPADVADIIGDHCKVSWEVEKKDQILEVLRTESRIGLETPGVGNVYGSYLQTVQETLERVETQQS